MPGRQRFKVVATGSQGSPQSIEARLRAALGRLDVHSEDSPVERDGDTVHVSVRLSRGQDRASARAEMRGVFANLANLEAQLHEHECFHGLEDDEDSTSCEHTLSVTRFVDGEEQARGRNGRQ